MTILVETIMQTARGITLDPNGVTWLDADMERFLNHVLASAANWKRDIYPQIITIPLVAGTIQTAPAGVLMVMEPYYNTVSGASCTKGELRLLSRRFPAWLENAPTTDVTDIFVDERSPDIFQCFPPNNGTGEIQALVGATPIIGAFGCLPTSNTVFPLPDNYLGAVVDGLVGLCFGSNTRRQDIVKANFYWSRCQAGIMGGKQAQFEPAPMLGEKE